MAVAARFCLALCAVGAAVPIAFTAWSFAAYPALDWSSAAVAIPLVGVAVAPFAAVAGSGWRHRREPRASIWLAVTAVVVLAVAAAGWGVGAQDTKGINLGLLGVCVVPPVQLAVWGIGHALCAGPTRP